MIGFLTNVAPIALGFIGKLFALKSQAAQENQKLMMPKWSLPQKKRKSLKTLFNCTEKQVPEPMAEKQAVVVDVINKYQNEKKNYYRSMFGFFIHTSK